MYETAMQRCFQLAEQGRGQVGNGALVGAVLLRGDDIVAEAAHTSYGKKHAERVLIEGFSGIQEEDILCVNLEPCHHYGKTPPCTDIIIQSGIKHVVYGMADPDKRVAGQGIAALRAAGITVTGPVLPVQARRLNKGFCSAREQDRPWCTLKKAQRVDGAIAQPDGSKLCITSHQQNTWSHRYLRARHDAVVVGVNTIITDNPQLTIRHIDAHYQPFRIIFDPTLRIPMDAQVLGERAIVVTSAKSDKMADITATGTTVWQLPTDEHGIVLTDFFQQCLTPTESFIGLTSLLIEGGPHTWQQFATAGAVDELVTLVR